MTPSPGTMVRNALTICSRLASTAPSGSGIRTDIINSRLCVLADRAVANGEARGASTGSVRSGDRRLSISTYRRLHPNVHVTTPSVYPRLSRARFLEWARSTSNSGLKIEAKKDNVVTTLENVTDPSIAHFSQQAHETTSSMAGASRRHDLCMDPCMSAKIKPDRRCGGGSRHGGGACRTKTDPAAEQSVKFDAASAQRRLSALTKLTRSSDSYLRTYQRFAARSPPRRFSKVMYDAPLREKRRLRDAGKAGPNTGHAVDRQRHGLQHYFET